MPKPLRWGILGTGNIARQFAAGMPTAHRSSLIAVGSRAAETASTFAGAHAVPAAYGSYDELVADPNVDAIYNSLPNNLHHHWTIQALRAGKHVLCEKPFALNEAESQEMFDAAHAAGKVLVEAFMYRSHPLTDAVAEAVRSGAIGRLKLIRTSFCYRTRRIEGNIRFDRSLGGGGLMDVGCYCVNFSRFFAGAEPTLVQAYGHLHETGVDDLATGIIQFPGGVVAHFACGMTVQADNTAYLCGDEGYIAIPLPWKPPASAAEFIVAHGSPPRMDAANSKAPAGAPPTETRRVDAGRDLYAMEADDFAAVVQDGVPPRITPEDTLGNMRVLDEMRRQLGVKF